MAALQNPNQFDHHLTTNKPWRIYGELRQEQIDLSALNGIVLTEETHQDICIYGNQSLLGRAGSDAAGDHVHFVTAR